MLQAVPFQWSMSAREPRPVFLAPLELPTAQASVSEVALTPCRLAFCPVGGIETMVQPPAPSAGLAPRIKAAPTTNPVPIFQRSMEHPFRRHAGLT
jgi:hypothetical protein